MYKGNVGQTSVGKGGRGGVYGSEMCGFQNVAFCLALKTVLGAGKSRLEIGRCGKVGAVVCAEK